MCSYIDKVHHKGRVNTKSNTPRPIIARFLYHQDADLKLSNAYLARRHGLRISADYTKDVLRDHIQLEKVHKKAHREGISTQLIGNKLKHNGKVYNRNSVQDFGLKVSEFAERRRRDFIRFYGRFSLFSNFHAAVLDYKQMKFHSAEQLYHSRRARGNFR